MTDPGSVPPPIAVSEPQLGAPRTIHPIGTAPLRVGRPILRRDSTTMDRPTEYHIVKTSEVRQSRSGRSSMQFAEGTKVPLHVAYEYGLIDELQLISARPEGEEPAVAPNDDPVFDQRSEGAAPENRMEPAPENRSVISTTAVTLDPLGELTDAEYSQLTPAEKGARTRKANEAKEQGEGTSEQGTGDTGDSE